MLMFIYEMGESNHCFLDKMDIQQVYSRIGIWQKFNIPSVIFENERSIYVVVHENCRLRE